MQSIEKALVHKLDNPVWYSLMEVHEEFCLDVGKFKFYRPECCPFGAFETEDANPESLQDYAGLVKNFFVVGNKPSEYPVKIKLENNLVCNQMIITRSINIDYTENIVLLDNSHLTSLVDLINLVQPGYFKEKTPSLGDYYGIFKEGRLVAVTGERMKMADATEISAVITHPDYLGKGYAKQLVSHVTNKVLGENKLPFLHVAETNARAIALYERLGYQDRRKISFWNYTAT